MTNEWRVTGSYFEACNCEAACPCVFTSPPTDGDCKALVGWHIDQGQFGDIRLNGLNAALFAYAPGPMLEGKWKVALYVDQAANDTQREALGQIFSGQAGGHLAGLGPLIGEVLGVKPAAMEFRENGKQRSLRITGVAEMEIEALAGQGGADITVTNHPLTVVAGFPAVVCRSSHFRFKDHGYSVDVAQKNGFYSPFAYQA